MKKWKPILILNLAVLWISFHSVAGVSFFHYGIEQGLSEQKISSIAQDSLGFIWMAGANSIFRFDGYHFTTYNQASAGTSEQAMGRILSLYADSRGTIWAGTTSGVTCFNYSGNKFNRLMKGWLKEDVNDIAEDYQGNLWMATSRGLAKVNPLTRLTTWYTGKDMFKTPDNNVLPISKISKLTCQDDGKIWFSDDTGNLFLFDPASLITVNKTVLEGVNFNKAGIKHLKYSDNLLFIGTWTRGLIWYNDSNQTIHQESFSGLAQIIKHFSVSSDSVLWVAGDNGLFHYNYISGKYTRYTEDPVNPLSLSRSAVSYICEDKDNNLWVSTGINGVDYGLTNTPFHHIVYMGPESYQLTRPEITAIQFDDKKNMWLGYEGGFLEKHFQYPVKKKIFYPESIKGHDTPGAIFAIHTDKNNQTWFGGWKSGLQKLNQSKTAFKKAPVLPESLANLLIDADIRGITEDNEGNLWISFHGFGIGRYNPLTSKLELFRNDPDNPEGSLSNDWTLNSCFDTKGDLWIATAHGVSRYNPRTSTFDNYYNDDNNPYSLNSNKIQTIYCDPEGMIWAGTDVGINVYIRNINAFVPFTDSINNVPHDVAAIRSTKPGEIWASTLSGIIHLKWSWDPAHQTVVFESKYHNRNTGLLSTMYFHRSSDVNSEGEIFFGGNEGIDIIESSKASHYNIASPEPRITHITIDGQHVPFDFYNPASNNLNLTHQTRNITIRFSAPDYNTSQKTRFRYRMEGFEEQWNYTHTEQMATYTSLPPGNFTFRVQSATDTGKWNPKDVSFSLSVKSPFWNTLPFYIIIGLAFLLIIVLVSYTRSRILIHRQKQLERIIKTRTRELLNKNTELENILQTRNKLFSIISHDLRSPFAGILGILELLAEEDPDIDEERKKEMILLAKTSAENTFELLDNLLTWAHAQMKEHVSRPAQHNLCTLLKKNIELRMPSAQQKEIEIIKNFPNNLNATFDREMINTVIRNLLNNAVKFTHQGGKIEVTASRINGEVKVSIADNGIGIDNSITENLFYMGNSNRNGTNGEKGTGLGLIICREFVEKNNGRIGVAPNSPKGTVFYFSLPAN